MQIDGRLVVKMLLEKLSEDETALVHTRTNLSDSTLLVLVNVALVAQVDFRSARVTVTSDTDEVAHRSGHHEQGRLLSAQLSRVLLQGCSHREFTFDR